VGLANLGSESETWVGSRVHLVGVSISFEKNFYRLPFTPPSLVRRFGPSTAGAEEPIAAEAEKEAPAKARLVDIASILGTPTVTVVRSSL
jgi:hypothetical protein